MMASINYLIYVSSASKRMSEQEIQEILASSQIKNARLQVTGLLVYRSGNFIQYIEGPQESIHSLYQSICNDSRHTDMTVIDEGTVNARLFGDWQMGYRLYSGTPVFGVDELAQDKTGIKKTLSDFIEKLR